MLRKVVSIVLSYMLVLSTYAATVSPKSVDMGRVIKKYDYLLSSHPQAHEETFKKETLESFEKELSEMANGLSKEELQIQINKLVENIPTIADREAFNKVLESSTKEELAKMVTSPSLLSQALQGEGANFSFANGPRISTIFIGLLAALVVAALLKSVSNAIKYDYYYSYSIEGDGWVHYNIFDEPITNCQFYQSTSESEKQSMIDAALVRCQASSKKPDTCRFSGWSIDTDLYYYGYGYRPLFLNDYPIGCWLKAQVKTDD